MYNIMLIRVGTNDIQLLYRYNLKPKSIMKKNFNLKKSALIVLTLALSFSCSTDESGPSVGQLNISAKGSFTNLTTNSSINNSINRVTTENIMIEEFRLNISEFELELDLEDDDFQEDQNEQWDDDGYFDYEDEIELMGPFELDLMSGQISFINVSVPVGNYDELEFKFDVSTNPSSDLFGKSVLIKGKIDSTPFIFWHNFNDEVEVDFEDPQFDISVSQINEGIVIDFDLGLILNSANGIDLSSAQDENLDGTIEISPEDADGNNELAESIRHKIKEYINLLDD